MIIGIAICIAIFSIAYILFKEPHGFPPGPLRCPVIGNNNLKLNNGTIQNLHDKFGSIFMIKYQKCNRVYVSDYNLAQTVLNDPDMSNRSDFQRLEVATQHTKPRGVILAQGHRWKRNRKLVHEHFETFETENANLVTIIKHESHLLIKELCRPRGPDASLSSLIDLTTVNIIWQIIGGPRLKIDDRLFQLIQNLGQEFLSDYQRCVKTAEQSISLIEKIIPRPIKNWISSPPTKLTISEAEVEVRKEVKMLVQYQLKSFENSQNSRSFIDDFLIETNGKDTEDLETLIIDLLQIGCSTISRTIKWFIVYLTQNPKAQNAIFEELKENNQTEQKNQFENPILESTIHEVLRLSSVFSFNMYRTCDIQTKIGNYIVPRETIVTTSNMAIHHNPRYWKDPQQFQPDRFLNHLGNCVTPKEGYLPFGHGMRKCAAENFAKIAILTVTENLSKNYRFLPITEESLEQNTFSDNIFGQEVKLRLRKM